MYKNCLTAGYIYFAVTLKMIQVRKLYTRLHNFIDRLTNAGVAESLPLESQNYEKDSRSHRDLNSDRRIQSPEC